MIWSPVRKVNALRYLLREYYPAALAAFGADLAERDALAVLAAAPSPDQGRRLSQARPARCSARPAYAASASALIVLLATISERTQVLAGKVEQGTGQHPDVRSSAASPASARSSAPGC